MNLLNRKLFIISIGVALLSFLVYYLERDWNHTNIGKPLSWICGAVALVSFIAFFVKEYIQTVLFKISIVYYFIALILLLATQPDIGSDFFSFGAIFQYIFIFLITTIYFIVCIVVSIFKIYHFRKNAKLI